MLDHRRDIFSVLVYRWCIWYLSYMGQCMIFHLDLVRRVRSVAYTKSLTPNVTQVPKESVSIS